MYTIKHVGVLSFVKIFALSYAAIGLLASPFFLAIGFTQQMLGQTRGPAAVIGVVMALLMPLVYGVMGLVLGALRAFLYNLLARWVGGLQVELELQHPAAAAAAVPSP